MEHPSSSSSFRRLFWFVLVVPLSCNIHGGGGAMGAAVPAIIMFGDSIVDPGNNNNLPTLIKCNFPPYGEDFAGRRPTGRFSNGFAPSDLFAQLFGVKELLPAYLDPGLQVQDLLTGVSFASGGCGYDPLTARFVSVLSLSDQLDLFREYLGRLRRAAGEARTADIISSSLFVVVAGSDDLANTYYSTPLRRGQYDISSYTDLMASSAISFFQELHGLGARKIGALSVPAIGCVPSQRTTGGGIQRGCAEERNRAASLFNSKLASGITALSRRLGPDTRLVYLDVYFPLLRIIRDPSRYGFEEVTRGCCGTGLLEVSILCNPSSVGTCRNASKYAFWDSYHPTQAAYTIVVRELVDRYTRELF